MEIIREKALRTDQVVSNLTDNNAPVVIICQSGAKGAKRAISVLKSYEGIAAGRMYKDGFKFFISENGVWLTSKVPVEYIKKID